MRIAYIVTTLGIGGAEKQVIALAERMAANGHSVTFVVLKYSSAEEWPVKLPVMRLNMLKNPKSVLKGLRFAQSFLNIFRPDILHSHTFPANIFARLLRRNGTSARVINTIHNVYEGGWHRMLLYRITDRYADKITVVSQAAADRFLQSRAISLTKTTLLTNGIDTQEFTPDKSRRRRARRLLEVADSFVWIAVGRLVPAKDYPNLLRAFAIVREVHPDAILLIVGEGKSSNIGMHQAYIPGVQLLGLRHDIPELIDAADSFVLSSAWEGMPLVVGEAMAMEKPVVATDVGGVRELVGKDGSLVFAKDSSALATAMVDMMARKEKERQEIGRMARARILEYFSIDAKAAQWEKFYVLAVRGD